MLGEEMKRKEKKKNQTFILSALSASLCFLIFSDSMNAALSCSSLSWLTSARRFASSASRAICAAASRSCSYFYI